MFRFSIRDIVFVTTIVAIVLGWTLDHWQLTTKINQRTALDNRFEVLRHLVEMDGSKVNWGTKNGNLEITIDPPPQAASSAPLPTPPGP
jgi:hypothetical protein